MSNHTPPPTATFEQKLSDLLNANSVENESDTPDYILAQFLLGCLAAWKEAVRKRDAWYGFAPWGGSDEVKGTGKTLNELAAKQGVGPLDISKVDCECPLTDEDLCRQSSVPADPKPPPLAMTADGAQAVPGMFVYVKSGLWAMVPGIVGNGPITFPNGKTYLIGDCYSTKEAAKAAEEKP